MALDLTRKRTAPGLGRGRVSEQRKARTQESDGRIRTPGKLRRQKPQQAREFIRSGLQEAGGPDDFRERWQRDKIDEHRRRIEEAEQRRELERARQATVAERDDAKDALRSLIQRM